MELTKIGRVNLEFKEVSELDIDIKKEFQDFEIVTSSFRIDSIVLELIQLSLKLLINLEARLRNF